MTQEADEKSINLTAGEYITDVIFEEIGRRILMIKDIQKKVGVVFQFNIHKKGLPTKTWILDGKSETPVCYPGECKTGKPNIIIEMSDDNMAKLALNELDPVKAFMSGHIRLKGNPMLTQKLDILFKLDSSDCYEQFVDPPPQDVVQQSAAAQITSPECKTDVLFGKWLINRLPTVKELIPSINNVYQWNIMKDGKVVSVWTCDFKNGDGAIHQGEPKTGKPNCTLIIEDDVAIEIFSGKLDAMKAFMSGKLKITGNVMAAQKLQKLWAEEQPPPLDELLSSAPAAMPVSNLTVGLDGGIKPKTPDEEIDAIPISGLRCDLIFAVFMNRCHEEPEFMKRLRVIFQFNVLKKGVLICTWTADNKTKPDIHVYRTPPVGIKPDVISTVEDDDLLKIMTGKVNPQRLFMMGKVKVKGNIMLLQKLHQLWLEYQTLGKTPELPLVVEVLMKDPIKEGLKSEAMIIDLMQRVVGLPQLPVEMPGLHQFNFTKNGSVASVWTLDFKTGRNTFYRGPPNGEAATEIEMDDVDCARLVLMHMRLNELLANGRVKIIRGDPNVVLKLDRLFTQPTSLKPKL